MTNNAAGDIDPEKSGYAFAGNTFSMAGGMIGLVRYDVRFAHDVAKWFLNAANNARLFYQNAHAPQAQSCAFFTDDKNSCIAYEGLRKYWDTFSPYATGDPIRYSWGSIDLGLYGSSHVGLFGGVYGTTSDEKILRIDCRAADFILADGYDTYLVYNPYDVEKTVLLEGLTGSVVFDAVSEKIIAHIFEGKAELILRADMAVVAVCAEGEKIEQVNGSLFMNGKIVKY